MVAERMRALIARLALWPSHCHILVACLLTGTMAVLYCAPIVGSGSSGEDIYRSQIVGFEGYHRLTPLAPLARVADETAAERGGFFPLRSVPLAFWLTGASDPAAKCMQLTLVVANSVTLLLLASLLFSNLRAGLLAAAFTLTALQFRREHDAVLGSVLEWTMLAELLLLSALLWTSYVRTRQLAALAGAVLVSAAAALTSEFAYPLLLLPPLFMLRSGERRPLGTLIAPLILIACIAVTIAVRAPLPRTFARTLDPVTRSTYARDVLTQLFAAVPASYRTLGGIVPIKVTPNAGDTRFLNVPDATLGGWCAIAIIALTVVFVLWRRAGSDAVGPMIPAVAAGCAFWFIPALVLGPPSVWSHGIPAGEATEAVYLQIFGAGLLLAAGCIHFISRQRPAQNAQTGAVAVGLAALLILYGNLRLNTEVIAADQRFDLARRNIEAAGRAGLFRRLPPRSRLIVDTSYPFVTGAPKSFKDARALFFHYTSRRLDLLPPRFAPRSHDGARELWVMRDTRVSANEFADVTLARYLRTRGEDVLTKSAIGYRDFGAAQILRAHRGAWSEARGVRVAASAISSTAIIFRLQRTCAPVPVSDVFREEHPELAWGKGAFPSGPYPRVLFAGTGADAASRFAGRRAEIRIVPDSCSPVPIQFRAVVYAYAPARLSIAASGLRLRTTRVSEMGTPLDLLIPANARPKFVVLQTNAARAPETLQFPRFRNTGDRSIHLLVVDPSVEDIVVSPRRTVAR